MTQIAVSYIRNLDPSESTAEAVLDGRPNLVLGKEPILVSEDEYQKLSQRVALQIHEEGSDEYNVAVSRSGVPEVVPEGDGLDSKTKSELENIAFDEDIDLSDVKNNPGRVARIREARSALLNQTSAPSPSTGEPSAGDEPDPETTTPALS